MVDQQECVRINVKSSNNYKKNQEKYLENNKNNSLKKDKQIKIYFNKTENRQTNQKILQHNGIRTDRLRYLQQPYILIKGVKTSKITYRGKR